MNPDDERMRNAMHNIEPGTTAGDDVPDLFERVAAGARRRRRVRSSGAVAGGALVVAAIAAVPAMNLGSSPSQHVVPLTAPSSDIDPGFTGQSPAPGQASPSTTAAVTQSASEAISSPTLTTVPSASSPSPSNSAGCPTVDSLPPGPDAQAQAEAAAVAALPIRYGPAAAAKAHVTSVYAASTGKGYGIVADGMCGKALGDNSYVVEFSFGNTDSASMGSGQLFLADFVTGGWQVWFQYH